MAEVQKTRGMPASQSLAGIAVALLVAAGIGLAGSTGGSTLGGVPVFFLLGALAFVVQWVMFVHAYARQTEHFFDLTGSATYLLLVIVAAVLSGSATAWLLAALVGAWAIRLGSFLFTRVREVGSDGRFDTIKPDFTQFLMTWTLQGLWVFITLAPALAAMTTQGTPAFGAAALAGTLIWAVGFGIEVVADQQKNRFRRDPANEGRFINEGLWAWSQHPNYFGEILLWCGIAVIALPTLSGWQYLTLISPLFVYVLLTRISGVRMLDARGRKKWGHDPEYQAYRKQTPVLIPRPPRGARG
jgi:steroid 5-alpha reductase family enzyme